MYTIKTINEPNLDADMSEQMYVLVLNEGVEEEDKMFTLSKAKDQSQYELYANDNSDFFFDTEMYDTKVEALERVKQLISDLNDKDIVVMK